MATLTGHAARYQEATGKNWYASISQGRPRRARFTPKGEAGRPLALRSEFIVEEQALPNQPVEPPNWRHHLATLVFNLFSGYFADEQRSGLWAGSIEEAWGHVAQDLIAYGYDYRSEAAVVLDGLTAASIIHDYVVAARES
jgi:hypothetical protein